jgi:hypothetical protein
VRVPAGALVATAGAARAPHVSHLVTVGGAASPVISIASILRHLGADEARTESP